MDNYFESFRLTFSNWTYTGRFLIYLQDLILLIQQNKKLIPVVSISYIVFCWYVYSLFSEFFNYGYFASIGSLLTATAFFVALWMVFSNYYFRRYRTDYKICIRDAFFQILASQIIAACFVVFGDLAIIGAFILSCVVFFTIYIEVLSKRKLPDTKIVFNLEVDSVLDSSRLIDIDSHELKKMQISGEVRNCLILKRSKPLNLKVKEGERLRLGVGIIEFTDATTRLEIKGRSSGSEDIDLFNKEFKPRTYFRDREWNDVLIELPKDSEKRAVDNVSFSVKSKVDSNLYISFPMVSEKKLPGQKPNIYILVVDSLRKDYFQTSDQMRISGHEHMAKLLEESVIYPNAYTQGAWTLPTLASLLSGLYTSYHDQHHPKLQQSLDKRIALLPEMLRSVGYDTYGYGTGPRTRPSYGYSRGFDRYYYEICDKEVGIATAESAFSWAKEQDRKSGYKKGQFFYLHLLEAHWPYYPPRDFEWIYSRVTQKEVYRDVKKYRNIKGALDFDKEQGTFFKDLYRAELDYCMYQIDQFLAYLKDREAYDDSLLVIMGDHGSNFNEHNPIDVFDLYQESVNVGMAIKFPKSLNRQGVDHGLIEANIDIAPTILDMLNLQSGSPVNGKSLLSNSDELTGRKDVVISEDLYIDRYSVSIRNKRNTFIYRTRFDGTSFKNFSRNEEKFELYDLEADSGEQENVFATAEPGIKHDFIQILNKHIMDSLNYHGVEDIVEIKI